MTRQIANINFPTATDAVVTFTDGRSGRASGDLCETWRTIVTAMVETTTRTNVPKGGVKIAVLVNVIRRALEGENG